MRFTLLFFAAACSGNPTPTTTTTATAPPPLAKDAAPELATTGGIPGACDKLWPKWLLALEARAKADNATVLDADRVDFMLECKNALEDNVPSDEFAFLYDCAMKADTADAVMQCQRAAKKLSKSDAEVQLVAIGNHAKRVFAATGAFPSGKASPAPAGPCCGNEFNRCPPSPTWESDPVWRALGYRNPRTSYWTFSYESADGRSFEATAIGDLDCDSITSSWKLAGNVVDGKPVLDLQRPDRVD